MQEPLPPTESVFFEPTPTVFLFDVVVELQLLVHTSSTSRLENPIFKPYTRTTMRRGTVIFLVINLLIISFLLNAFSTLISLLFETGAADAIARAEIPAPGSELIDNQTQLIPRIIHQTYINSSIPPQWKPGQQSCVDLHKDYQYIVRCT